MRLRRTGSFATLGLLTGVMASAAAPATGDQIRTDTSLGGYSVTVSAAPVRVLVDDPTNPIPRPPNSAIVEADPAYTMANLESGPSSRALASSLWPGNLLGDGWSQIVGQVPIPGLPATYPVKADARYPDNPHTADAGEGGTFMKASALGLDVAATARDVPGAPAGPLDVGTATSTSTATVKNGVAIGTAVSKVTDLDLMGLIKVGSVSTTLTASSDGRKPTSEGSTVVSGLTIAGVGYVVDGNGARPVGAPVGQGTGPLPSGVLDPAKALGITIDGITQDHTADADTATRTTTGLRIVIDTIALRTALSPVTGPLQDPLATLISNLPAAVQGYAYMAAQTTPKITLLIGSGSGTSAATLPITFSFPPDTFPAFVAPAAPSVRGAVPPPAPGPVSLGAPAAVTAPVTAPVTRPVASASVSRSAFEGIPAALFLLLVAAAGTAGAGLVRLREAAMAEPGSTLPDLREA